MPKTVTSLATLSTKKGDKELNGKPAIERLLGTSMDEATKPESVPDPIEGEMLATFITTRRDLYLIGKPNV